MEEDRYICVPIDSVDDPLQCLYVVANGNVDKETIKTRLEVAGFNLKHYNVILISSINDLPIGYKVEYADQIDITLDDLDCSITQLVSCMPYTKFNVYDYDHYPPEEIYDDIQQRNYKQLQYDKKQSKAYKACKCFKPVNNSRAYARSILNHTTKHR